jgi:hypothetical protein
MKSTTPLFIMAVLLFLVSEIQSPDLQINRGNKTKTFKVGHLIKIDEPTMIFPECATCPNTFAIGRLESFNNDTLLLRIKVQSIPTANNGKEVGTKGIVNKDKMESEWPVFIIPASSILGVTRQGIKKWKPVNDGDLCGSVFSVFGIIFLSAAIYADGEENTDALVGTGATMTGLGLAMMTVFNRKTYYLDNPLNTNQKSKSKPWSFK